MHVQEYVAVWAMDPAHFDILRTATGGQARTIWGYMDQEFSDQVSTVPFPSPVPPQVVVRLCHLLIQSALLCRHVLGL